MENSYVLLKLVALTAIISLSNGENSADMQRIWQTLAKQQDAIVQLTKDNTDLKYQLDQQKRELYETSERVQECSRNKRILLEEPYGGMLKIGFTVKLTKHMLNLGNNQAIVFDKIVTNIGNYYSPNTGVFTAPTNGTFYFFASILSHTGEALETEIVKNGIRMVMMYSYDNVHEQGTNGVVLQLTAGDEVWVRHIQSGSKVYGNGWSTFSGFKISDD